MNIEINEELRERIEYFAAIFKQTPAEYLATLIQRIVPPIPNQADAVQHLQDLLDGRYSSEEGEGELEDYVRGMSDSRLKLPAERLSEVGGTKS